MMHAPFNLFDLTSHPLAKDFRELREKVEALPAGPEQTAVLTDIHRVMMATEKALNEAWRRS